MIIRATPELPKEMGYGDFNGYVAVPPGHPWFGVHHDAIPNVVIHGGLTYSEMEGGLWVVGFDTLHYGDTATQWTFMRVAMECHDLLRQALAPETLLGDAEPPLAALCDACGAWLDNGPDGPCCPCCEGL